MTKNNNKNIPDKAVQMYLNEIGRLSGTPISEKEEKELFKKLGEGDSKAHEKISYAYLKLVVEVAEYYLPQAKKLSFLDLIQEGNSGLFKAINLYDYKCNYKFSVFAVIVISYAIKESLIDEDETINKNPMYDFARKYKENLPKILADKKVRTYWHFFPTLYKNAKGEILLWEFLTGKEKRAIKLSEPKGYKEKIINFAKDNLSELTRLISEVITKSKKNSEKEINKIIGEVADSDLDKIAISKATDEEINNARKIYRNILQQEIKRNLGKFSQQEQKVLRMRFGLDDGIVHTLGAVEEEFRPIGEKVQQIEKKAMELIEKDASLSKKLWVFEQ